LLTVHYCITMHSTKNIKLLGVFAKLQTVTLFCLISPSPSSCLYRTTWLPLDGFSWNLMFENILKIGWELQITLQSQKNKFYSTWRPIYIYNNILLNSLRMENVSDKSCREDQNTFYIQWIVSENCAIYVMMWKIWYSQTSQKLH